MQEPIIKGGQGRSAGSIRRDASSLAFTLLMAFLLAVALAIRALGYS